MLMDATKVTGSAIQAAMEENVAHEIAFHSERMDVSAACIYIAAIQGFGLMLPYPNKSPSWDGPDLQLK